MCQNQQLWPTEYFYLHFWLGSVTEGNTNIFFFLALLSSSMGDTNHTRLVAFQNIFSLLHFLQTFMTAALLCSQCLWRLSSESVHFDAFWDDFSHVCQHLFITFILNFVKHSYPKSGKCDFPLILWCQVTCPIAIWSTSLSPQLRNAT